MKARIFILAACLLVAAAVVAADISGKWVAQIPGRDGQMRETTFNFKVDGEKLTGTVSGRQGAEMPIADGKVTADEISFTVTMSFGGNEMKFQYKGKVAGDEIKFSRTREGADQAQEFVAKRPK